MHSAVRLEQAPCIYRIPRASASPHRATMSMNRSSKMMSYVNYRMKVTIQARHLTATRASNADYVPSTR